MSARKYIRWMPVVIWMGVIFYLSAQPAGVSKELSKGVMQVVVQGIGTVLPLEESLLHQVIRKGAHFGAYFILAILLMIALEEKCRKITHQMVGALFICIVYAISDEVHQLFVPGRSGEVGDVIIDTIGASCGIIIYSCLRKIFKMLRR